VQSTPTFFANGEKVEHMHTIEEARKILDTLLAGKSLAEEAKEAAAKATAIRATDIVLGKDNAKVEVVEYANIACAHCGQVHKSLLAMLQKDYIDTGKVKFAFRELPMNPNAFHAFMLAHCKGKDEFYNILTLLIDETPQWAGSSAFIGPLRKVAEKAGISKEAFYSCMESKDAETRVTSMAKEAGEVLAIHHSPAIYINGQLVQDLNPDAIRQVVDSALAK
jgi:protein-disulfide isomerase